jgi:membrane-anchored mycosin MYCP
VFPPGPDHRPIEIVTLSVLGLTLALGLAALAARALRRK